MSNLLLKNANIHTGEEELLHASIYISEGKIVEVGDYDHLIGKIEDCQIIDCKDKGWLLPGMIDVHIHGAGGHDVMDATAKALSGLCTLLPKEGTTSFLATTMTQSETNIEKALVNISSFLSEDNKNGAEIIGVHLEGPFINPEKRGAQLAEHIQTPDVEKFKRWHSLSGESIKLITIAPEKDKEFQLIKYLKELGVTVSMGHTNGTYKEMSEAIAHGVTHATHLYNGMSGLHHREPGVAGAALLSDDVSVELILDGFHVRPEMAELTYRIKTADKIILITDAMRAKCLADGTYDLGGQVATLKDGKVENQEGSLAGSVLKMKDARNNFAQWIDNDLSVLTKITSVNPAKQIGVYDRKGSIHPGKDADIIMVNDSGEIILTICRGEVCHEEIS
ncbi:N-acetylglucosamine-6-phosphate deacetylase [Bacillus sp. M6-12]|uniref:N-acetylglucosamine-6-phosphate deacetylase n=1 Tax=Bacillus sp. M6-12 TaxID=2054166 RepID=UPI000C769C4E|nr:N-acetylglucosamine-6-phosphate deacetylase [Bacillus sp. M6-12]PLS18743.1 N-acetylglucosamine-6-phosphate deacetylase [Bacillus sp. M6-12]